MVAEFISPHNDNNFDLPEWLEEFRVPDNILVNAYENLPSSFRASLKTALALYHLIFNKPLINIHTEITSPHDGFWTRTYQSPALWTFILFGENFRGVARLCSLGAMSVLADVKNICAICLEGPLFPDLLPALELCGIENIFSLDISTFQLLLNELLARQQIANGRILLLHEGELAQVGHLARELKIPYYEEFRKPELLIQTPDKFSRELLIFAQGFYPAAEESGTPDAVYTALPSCTIPSTLYITPGLEGFWLYQDLSPDFFKLSSKTFGLL